MPVDRFMDVKGRIACPFPIINSVINRQQEGEIFIWENELDFIIHKAGFSYINITQGSLGPLPDFFIHSSALPEYFHVYDPPSGLIDACNNQPDHLNIRVRERIQLQLSNGPSGAGSFGLPDKYAIRQIDAGNLASLSVFQLGIGDKFWRTPADFLANGYGCALFNERAEPVSICYTAALADGIAEIDIMTLQEYRGTGLGKIVLNAFIEQSLDRGVTPNWDCFESNIASLKTALSLGFLETKRYIFLSIFKKTRKNENF